MSRDTERVVYYVSPSGSDADEGTQSKPLKTVEEALRRLKDTANATVRLLGGIYRAAKAIYVGTENSGATIEAAAGEAPAFDGSIPLEDRDFVPLAQAAGERFAAARRVPEAARANVWVYDLKAHGVPAGKIYKNGFNWPLMPCSPELVVDGRLQTLAGWPKGRSMTRAEILIGREIKGRENNHTPEEHARYLVAMHSGARQGGIPRAWYFDKCDTPKTYEEMLALDAPIFYAASDELRSRAARWLPSSADAAPDGVNYETDAYLTGYFENNYADDMSRLKAFDPQKQLLYLEHPVMQGVQDFWLKLRAVNLLSELSEPGEYYIDRFNGNDVLYYYPEGGTPLGKSISLTALSEPVFRLEGAKQVTLRGLALKNGTGNGAELYDCEDCQIEGCEICNFSLDAIRIGSPAATITADPTYSAARGGRSNVVRRCYIHDMGGGGVYMAGGDRQTLERGNHLVEDCEFYRLSNKRTYSPAAYMVGVGHTIRSCYIHSSPHMSVQIMGNDMLVSRNRIEGVCLNASDQGAIYAGRCYNWLGNEIIGNVIRHVGGKDNHGIYLDDGMSGMLVRGNVFEDISGHCLFLNSGHDNSLKDNIFICENSAIRLWGFERKRPVGNEKTLYWRWRESLGEDASCREAWIAHYKAIYPHIDRLYYPAASEPFPVDEYCVFNPAHHIFSGNVIVGSGSLHNGTAETMEFYDDSFGRPLFRASSKQEIGLSSDDGHILAESALDGAEGFGPEWIRRFNDTITGIGSEEIDGKE